MVLFLGHARSSVFGILFKFGVFKLLEVLVATWVILLDWSSMRAMIFSFDTWFFLVCRTS
jgi:hypothetical protein